MNCQVKIHCNVATKCYNQVLLPSVTMKLSTGITCLISAVLVREVTFLDIILLYGYYTDNLAEQCKSPHVTSSDFVKIKKCEFWVNQSGC